MPGHKVRISTRGGTHPRWRPEGKALFYIDTQGQLTSVPIRTGASLDVGRPEALFPIRFWTLDGRFPYDVANDGQRFLVITQVGEPVPPTMTVTLDWSAGLRR